VGTKQETFGVIFATVRTQVDRIARTVVFENLKVYTSSFALLIVYLRCGLCDTARNSAG
jgi:hypothetical protein